MSGPREPIVAAVEAELAARHGNASPGRYRDDAVVAVTVAYPFFVRDVVEALRDWPATNEHDSGRRAADFLVREFGDRAGGER